MQFMFIDTQFGTNIFWYFLIQFYKKPECKLIRLYIFDPSIDKTETTSSGWEKIFFEL